MKCPLVGAGLITTLAGFAIACLTKQKRASCYDKGCVDCPTGKDFKTGKSPKILPEGLTILHVNDLPKNLKSPRIKAVKELPFGVNKQYGKSKYPIHLMKVGDTIYLNYELQKTIRSVMYNISNKKGWEFKTRKDGNKLRIKRTK